MTYVTSFLNTLAQPQITYSCTRRVTILWLQYIQAISFANMIAVGNFARLMMWWWELAILLVGKFWLCGVGSGWYDSISMCIDLHRSVGYYTTIGEPLVGGKIHCIDRWEIHTNTRRGLLRGAHNICSVAEIRWVCMLTYSFCFIIPRNNPLTVGWLSNTIINTDI